MKLSPQRRMPRRIALGVVLVVLSISLAATAATASASSATPATSSGSSDLTALAQTSLAPSRTAALATAPGASMTTTAYRRPAPAARVRKAAATKSTRADHTHVSAARRTSLRKSAVRTVSTSVKKTSSGGGELDRARAILARYIAKYPICNGAKVYVGMVPALHGGTQGCVFLSSATIVINPNHTASLESIIAHEINHLKQYRESR